MVKHLKVNRVKGVTVPPGYEAAFRAAEVTFMHQRVWCPTRRSLVHLTEPLPTDFEFSVDDCCGPGMDDATAREWVGCGAEPPGAPCIGGRREGFYERMGRDGDAATRPLYAVPPRPHQ